MSEENPWKTLSSRVVYHNPWIKVREDQVLRPDGKPGIYGVVETKVACGVVALSESNEVYLVGQYRYPTEMYSWEIVEGGAEHGEDPLEATKRELQEEAGLTAASWEPLGDDIHLSNCFSSEVAKLYLARELTIGEAAPDGDEVLTVRKASIEECMKMIEDGCIKDAMSIIGLHRVERLVKKPKV